MREIFTIGHSNQTIEEFINLLKKHSIEVIADVRSSPYSKFNPQFNRETLKISLKEENIKYVHLGDQLGPRSDDPECCIDGIIDYKILARQPIFQEGKQRLRNGMEKFRIALMCAEKDPLRCHRMILICRNLKEKGLTITHILLDGTLENNKETENRLMELMKIPSDDLLSSREELLEQAYDRQGEKIAYQKKDKLQNRKPVNTAPDNNPKGHTQLEKHDIGESGIPEQILKKYFGFDSFVKNQREIIEKLIDGKNVFALMPTGSGKSLCYQISSMVRPGVGIIISPLIALMQNQVDALKENGVAAEFFNSSLSPGEAAVIKQKLITERIDLLYVAPERLLTDWFEDLLHRTNIALFAIDEAHCISMWGHSFREEYLVLAKVLDKFPNVPRIAMTATADRITRKDIIDKLALSNAQKFISSFDRPNIRYRIGVKNQPKKQLLAFLENEHPGESGIVYCLRRKDTEKIAAWLSGKGFKALAYHAQIDEELKKEHLRRFLQEDEVIIVATIAFGMGIDKPDVRFVVHLDLPKTIEAYYQETGRAGRDGKPADAWMLYSLADVITLTQMIDNDDGDEQFRIIQRQKLAAILGLCEIAGCRRQALLAYFDEKYPEACDNCDTCKVPVEIYEGKEILQMALVAVFRTGQRFGAGYLTDLLCGKIDPRMISLRHDSLKVFGAGKDLTEMEWKSVYRQLIASGCLNITDNGGFSLSDKGESVMRGEDDITLRKDPRATKIKKEKKKKRALEQTFEISDPEQIKLRKELRELRLELAKEKNIPPYCICHDRTLDELVTALPQNIKELSDVYGMGVSRIKHYGQQFLDIINKYDL